MIDKSYQEYRERFSVSIGERSGTVDAMTAEDLHLDEVFICLDHTLCGPGGALLYYWLRSQCKDEAELHARLALRGSIAGGDKAAFVSKTLKQAGKQKVGSLVDELLSDEAEPFAEYRTALLAWSVAFPIVIALSLLLQLMPVFVILAVCVANLALYLKTTPLISHKAASIEYFCKLKKALLALEEKDALAGHAYAQRLKETAAGIRKIKVNSVLFFTPLTVISDMGASFLLYFKMFFLGELTSFLKFHGKLSAEKASVFAMYELLGEIDVNLSLDGLLARLSVALSTASDGGLIEARGMTHPLVPRCVPFSIAISKDLIITGTNMSGKTTFMRTLGLNQILATSLGICYAEAFSTNFLRVVSSISIHDDLLNAKSRYLREAERMLFVIDQAKRGPCLVLVDEILTGTNSADRIRASIGILSYLAKTDSLVAATTHDLEIAHALGGEYEPFFFEEDIVGDDLVFDYRLKPGIIDRRNALRILEHLGFGAFIADLKS